MAAKFMNNRNIQLFTSEQVRKLRLKLKMNQSEFWSALGVSQSGGSRYEGGRNIPEPVQLLLKMVYGPKVAGDKLLKTLREQVTLFKVKK